MNLPPRRTGAGPAPARWALPTVCLALAGLVLGPALGPGYVLSHDMVFVPRLPLTPRLLGIDSAAPRAVLSDAVVAVSSLALPGQVVQKGVLLAVLALGGLGAARVVPLGLWGRLAAAILYIWNPYVAERLGIGQWAVLVGYAALPWVARAAFEAGRGDRWWPLAVAAGLGSLGGAPAWAMVVPVALIAFAVGRRGARDGGRARWLGALLVALALPWAVPALARPGSVHADPAGAQVFGVSSDVPAGPLASVVTGGGIWNTEVVPPGRDTLPSMLAALVILGVAAFGVGAAWRTRPADRARTAAAVAPGLLALLVVTILLVPGLAGAAAHLPGGGLLRDVSRLLGPWVLATAVGFGLAVDVLADGSPGFAPGGRRWVPRVLPALLVALPVAALPALGWGLGGALRSTEYPPDFGTVASQVSGGPPGAVVVLPFESYRRYPWNAGTPSLDPVPRWLSPPTVGSADLVVRRRGVPVRVRGEDPFADRVAAVLAGPDPVPRLAEMGVAWIVVDVDGVAAPDGAELAYAGPALSLYRVPGVGVAGRAPTAAWEPAAWVVVLADAAAVAVWVLVATRRPRPRAAGPGPARGGPSGSLG
jgi:hypothetical protein